MSGGAFTTKPVYNADLLDNKDSTEFLDSTASVTVDWNSAAVVGFYFGTNAANSPAAGRFFGRVNIDPATNDIIQELTAVDDTSSWVRVRQSGSWGSYRKIFPVVYNDSSQSLWVGSSYGGPLSLPNSGANSNIWVV